MKNIILIVSLLLMGVSSRADILNSSDNKNVADKFDPMLKAALFQMKIIADTSSILLSDIDYVEDLELKTSLWINNDVNRAKTTRHEITSLKGLEYFSSLRRLKLVGNRTDTLECIPDFSRFKELRELEIDLTANFTVHISGEIVAQRGEGNDAGGNQKKHRQHGQQHRKPVQLGYPKPHDFFKRILIDNGEFILELEIVPKCFTPFSWHLY